MGILAVAVFAVSSMYHHVKGEMPGHLGFVRDIILPIAHIDNWNYICYHKQAQMYKD